MNTLRPAAAAVALVLAAGIAPLPGAAQEVRSDSLFTTARILDFETVADPQISPDGRHVVYTRRWVDKLKDRWESSLWIVNADGTRNRFLVNGSNATWSPDGTRIAYLAEGEPKGTQVWVKYLDAEGATQVTRLSENPANVRWSPDGRSLGFTQFVPQETPWKIDLPAAPAGAQWTEAPRVVNRLHYRADRQGFLKAGNIHLFVVPADGGTARQVTTGDWSVGSRFDQLPGGVAWDWMPDGRTVVVEGLKIENPDSIYRDSYLYAVNVANGAVRQLTPDRGSWGKPAVSPDGSQIAFVGTPYSRMSYHAGDLWLTRADGGGIRRISGNFDRDPDNLVWAANGGGVYFTAQSEGSSNVYFAPLQGGGVRPVTRGAQVLTLNSLSRAGVGVGVRSTAREPGDVVRFEARNPAEVTRLTRVNDDVLQNVALGEVEEIWYTSSGGARVQGWIVKPPRFDPSRKYPLLMEIHGGPHSMYNVGFNTMFQNFAANGFVVLYTNPRGSTGYGTEFGNAIQRAYPSVDYDDLMAGVDAVIAKGYVDPANLFVGGCSGGGVLTSWVIGHTDRFRAAAVRCPVINWLSFAGQTDVPLFTANFFDKPFWEDPQAWLKQSPLMYVGNVNTPTLIMTGELDLRTPMPQSEEYFAALKTRGVPTTLLRFAGEYHGTGSRPSNWMRTQLYMMDWYRRWGTFDDAAPRAAAP
ncbi:S9 family peptidase [Longimicrobium sp.]|jgi:dipeptidyl aminopeptidase/acylaminoacyl peptidase|uniref:S9 family peptidase n=1 Tax=Longimicrobium sp. TaxID=2029185 RepID=UPI002F943C5F